MRGKELYEKEIEFKIQKLINNNPELSGFYGFMINDSLTTSYYYLTIVKSFLKQSKKTSDQLNIDDFSLFMGTKRNKTSSYRIATYHALKKYGEYLKYKGVLNENPVETIRRPKSKESEKTIIKRSKGFLSQKEIKQYISAIEEEIQKEPIWGIRDLAIIEIFLGTGIRNSAMYKLDVSSIDFEKGTLVVTDKEGIVNTHKLSEEIMQSISLWLTERKKILRDKNEDALFISNQKKRISNHALYNVVKKYGHMIKRDDLSPHKLRATYGSQLYEATKDIFFVQQCMHHSSSKTTALYIRGQGDRTEEAANIMNKLL